ncbi:MAG: amidohydrolase family protein [Sphingomonas taxi]
MRSWGMLAMTMALALALPAGAAAQRAEPIIDMHLHAYPADAQGPPPVVVCAPYDTMPGRDPRMSDRDYAAATFKVARCRHPIWSAKSDEALRAASLAMLRRYDITAVTGGPLLDAWRKAGGERIIPSLEFGLADAPPPERIRALAKSGAIRMLGEITTQYEGVGPDDPRLEPYWALAEELDLPVGIHMGPGPPGAAYLGAPKFRMSLGDPLLLEPVLLRHPRLRVYVMHAGWPMVDRMIALMYAFPQVHVDTAVIDFTQPRAEFWAYLKRLVDAGYGRRILFGSDQMVWPDAIPVAIDAIRSAPFLTAQQKRDILHDNAARFLHLTPQDTPTR